jgi:hypothetical protein
MALRIVLFIDIDNGLRIFTQVTPILDTTRYFCHLDINPHWARVVGYGPFSLCVIYKECLFPSSGDINRLMMMISDTT